MPVPILCHTLSHGHIPCLQCPWPTWTYLTQAYKASFRSTPPGPSYHVACSILIAQLNILVQFASFKFTSLTLSDWQDCFDLVTTLTSASCVWDNLLSATIKQHFGLVQEIALQYPYSLTSTILMSVTVRQQLNHLHFHSRYLPVSRLQLITQRTQENKREPEQPICKRSSAWWRHVYSYNIGFGSPDQASLVIHYGANNYH